MKKIAVYSIKGGVGKSTISTNLAALFAKAGHKTIVVDLDAQGASSFYLNVDPVAKGKVKELVGGKSKIQSQIRASDIALLDVLPARRGLRNLELELDDTDAGFGPLVATLSKEYEVLIIDSPPQIGRTGEAIFGVADILISPVIPSPLSLRTLEQLYDFYTKKDLDAAKIFPLVSMVDFRKNLHKEYVELIRQGFPSTLKTMIPNSVRFEKMGIQKAPLVTYEKSGPALESLKNLFEEIIALGSR